MSNNNVFPCKEKLYSIISEIFDKCKDIIVDSDDILEYDAVEITLLLKSIGFRLSSLEFTEPPNENSNDIEIELKCRKSGLCSKMILENRKCSCPLRKGANNNSFWEVQGIDPSTPVKSMMIQDTSCNLLPDISKRKAKFAKLILAILLQNFQTNVSESDENKTKMIDVKQIVERFQSKAEKAETSLRSISPVDKLPSKNIQCSLCCRPVNSVLKCCDVSTEYLVPKIEVIQGEEVGTDDSNIKQAKDISTNTHNKESKQNKDFQIREMNLMKEMEKASQHLCSAISILTKNSTNNLKPNSRSRSNSPNSNEPISLPVTNGDISRKPSGSNNSNIVFVRRRSTGSHLDENNQKNQNTKSNGNNNGTVPKRRTIGLPVTGSSTSKENLDYIKRVPFVRRVVEKAQNNQNQMLSMKRSSSTNQLIKIKSTLPMRAQSIKTKNKNDNNMLSKTTASSVK